MTDGRSRRRLLASLAIAGLGDRLPAANAAATGTASVGSRSLRLLVGFPAGGGTDAIARLLAEPMREALGVPVLVENRPGAGGQIAAQLLRAASPDGATLLLSHDHTLSIVPLVTPNPGYDPDRDFTAVAGFTSFVNAVALGLQAGASTLGGLLARGRDSGTRIPIGVPAPASVPEFVVQMLARRESTDLVAVPYKGSAPMLADLTGGQIAAAIASLPELIDLHRAGRARIVAVLGAARQPLLPEVPTLAELGLVGFEATPYYGLFAPTGTPAPALARISAALASALDRRDIRERLLGWGLDIRFMPGPELAARERAYRTAWASVLTRSGSIAR